MVPEKVEALLTIAKSLAQIGQGAARPFGDAVPLGHRCPRENGGFANPSVEVSDVAFGIEQSLMVVLTVQVDQRTAQGAKPRNGRHLSADPAGRAPFRHDLALDVEKVVLDRDAQFVALDAHGGSVG